MLLLRIGVTFSLTGRILAKIKRGKASKTVIVPCWQFQPWFPQFLRMVEQGTAPVLLKADHKLLQLPGTGQVVSEEKATTNSGIFVRCFQMEE